MKNKKGFEFSFGWLFAVIVGAVIIAIAIYGAASLIRENRNIQDSFAGKSLGILLAPVETSLEEARTSKISFPVETKVYNGCDARGNFGSQRISVATKSGVGKEWQDPGVASTFYNKYLFSENEIQGTGANVFAKPFKFPYKTADLIFIWSNGKKYCFVNAPDDIEEELSGLQIDGVNVTSDIRDCKSGSTKVCFSNAASCEVVVDLTLKTVRKNGNNLYYAEDDTNALLYGAIFADKEIYECQVKRLMKRTAELALVYKMKSEMLSPKGCNSNLEGDLSSFANQTLFYNETRQLIVLEEGAKQLEVRNNALLCKLF